MNRRVGFRTIRQMMELREAPPAAAAPRERKAGRLWPAVLRLLLWRGGVAEMESVRRALSPAGGKSVTDSTWNELFENGLVWFPRDGWAALTEEGRSEAGRCVCA
jgi:hypothetical protein